MNVGLGLPISDPPALLDWARHADAGPFTTLALLDRLAYDNPEPLVALAMLAGATTRVRVQTEVLLAPLRQPALMAKQAATLDRMSGGRLTLGIGLGARRDDYRAAGVDLHGRGALLDEIMTVMRRVWHGEPYGDGVGPVGPAPAREGGPEVLFGAFSPAAIRRIARLGDGFLCASPLADVDRLFRATEHEWQAAGRSGRPRLVAQVNAALGPDPVIEEARDALHRYYSGSEYMDMPADYADVTVERMLTTPGEIRDALTRLNDLGADEVMFYCWSGDADQVDRFAQSLAP
ncbi:alkanesulfonate monooxygenase SsuD/methylene tetrahydromethanopterin reductase-like flavin-dependent oxidoreductase (luciferase family) [Streptosporangium album]|uniref:Alkanesulfonate monooxygenase SsuD/methylene tetrahydromethanopterin reductase-like flavin-dependent oxidoreductase (Luciferase family) n=1 Tax=Streptosporangium album TaxID=47479 RepID=A0A7W7RRJ7_9ACTN|nr:LLM class flavin-dependent oxidoreductase [Streptosporangium album]MBB4936849.1 alkanesulfonate monooxygenase SsuD/methylene tetrahydromethanopterin reductase-like flavin-dependent oxidoreductase (luciferase family) [Streptosporangium album]